MNLGDVFYHQRFQIIYSGNQSVTYFKQTTQSTVGLCTDVFIGVYFYVQKSLNSNYAESCSYAADFVLSL